MHSVIIADDEIHILKGIRDLVNWNSLGFEIIGEADNGQSCLELISKIKPDLVILDIRMPFINGLDVIREAKIRISESPVFVIISGFSDFSFARTAIGLGVHNYLLKPIQKEELKEALLSAAKEICTRSLFSRKARSTYYQALLNAADTGERAVIMGCSPGDLIRKRVYLFQLYVLNDYENRKADQLMGFLEALIPIDGECLLCNEKPGFLEGLIPEKGVNPDSQELTHFESMLTDYTSKNNLAIRLYLSDRAVGFDRIGEKRKEFDTLINGLYYASGPLPYKERRKGNFTFDPSFSSVFDGLINCTILLSQTEMSATIHRIGERLKKDNIAPEMVKSTISSVLIKLMERINDKGGDLENFFLNFRTTSLINPYWGLDKSLEALTDLCSDVIGYLESIYSDETNPVVREVQLYISRYYENDLSVQKIAEAMHLHPNYLGHLFKKETGYGIKHFLHKTRIEKAMEYLKKEDVTVSDVSGWVGYGNVEYFHRKFKAFTGRTPKSLSPGQGESKNHR